MKRIALHIPSGQVIRYLVVGAWNTLFGYGCFFLFARLFLHMIASQPAIAATAASVVATTINITVSFVGYKYFVFRTKGNFLREFARSFLVYLPSLFINAISIAPLASLVRRTAPLQAQRAPYIAGAILALVTVAISFVGHKNISFREQSVKPSS
jgi:putative flippase GtrA